MTLTEAQENTLADIADGMDQGKPYRASPGLGPVRVLAELGLIKGKNDDPRTNKWSWSLTPPGHAHVGRRRRRHASQQENTNGLV